MTPDILFWFYKEITLCSHRVQQLKRLNPTVRIYALYGGPLEDASAVSRAMAPLVDDLYIYPHDRAPKWKWKHGDQLIADWHQQRGRYLNWDTLSIVQWDMLVAAPQEELFGQLKPGEMLLSGLRPLNSIGNWWNWSRPSNANFIAFKRMLKERFNYEGDLWACLFIVICFPRIFLDRYLEIGHPMTGFLEYKIPTLARVFEIPFCTAHHFEPWWPGDPEMATWPVQRRLLAPLMQEVSAQTIAAELSKPDGGRVFHPVSEIHDDLVTAEKR